MTPMLRNEAYSASEMIGMFIDAIIFLLIVS